MGDFYCCFCFGFVHAVLGLSMLFWVSPCCFEFVHVLLFCFEFVHALLFCFEFAYALLFFFEFVHALLFSFGYVQAIFVFFHSVFALFIPHSWYVTMHSILSAAS